MDYVSTSSDVPMIKLAVYMDRVSTKGVEARCFVFEFNNEAAAKEACQFFMRYDCKALIIRDKAL